MPKSAKAEGKTTKKSSPDFHWKCSSSDFGEKNFAKKNKSWRGGFFSGRAKVFFEINIARMVLAARRFSPAEWNNFNSDIPKLAVGALVVGSDKIRAFENGIEDSLEALNLGDALSLKKQYCVGI